jgi:hypothetical protein
MEPFITGIGFIPIFFILFGIVLTILWMMLPFSIFGIKNRLDFLINKLEKLNVKISKIEKEIGDISDYLKKNKNVAPKEPDKKEKNSHQRYLPKGIDKSEY